MCINISLIWHIIILDTNDMLQSNREWVGMEMKEDCEFIEIDDIILRILIYEKTNYMASNKTSTASDYYILHFYIYFQEFIYTDLH